MKNRKIKSIKLFQVFGSTPGAGRAISQVTQFNEQGDQILMEEYDDKGKLTYSSRSSYDSANRIIKDEITDQNEGKSEVIYEYNDHQLVKRIDRIGDEEMITLYQYGKDKIEKSVYTDEGDLVEVITESYDEQKRLLQVVTKADQKQVNRTVYHYDQPKTGQYLVETFDEKNKLVVKSVYNSSDDRILLEHQQVDKKLLKTFEEIKNTPSVAITKYLYAPGQTYTEEAIKDENGNVTEFKVMDHHGKKVYSEWNEYKGTLVSKKRYTVSENHQESLEIKSNPGKSTNYLEYSYEFY